MILFSGRPSSGVKHTHPLHTRINPIPAPTLYPHQPYTRTHLIPAPIPCLHPPLPTPDPLMNDIYNIYFKIFSAFIIPGAPVKPACGQVYNLFHPFEPFSARIEPLILPQFSQISSVNVARYQKFPRGDGVINDVMAEIGGRPKLFREKLCEKVKVQRTSSNMSTCSNVSVDLLDFSVSEAVREGQYRVGRVLLVVAEKLSQPTLSPNPMWYWWWLMDNMVIVGTWLRNICRVSQCYRGFFLFLP